MPLAKTDLIWLQRKTLEGEGIISDLLREIPTFESEPFRIGNKTNEYLRLIARKPLDSDPLPDREFVPVAAVSKGYSLVQHKNLLKEVLKGLAKFEKFVSDPHTLRARLRLSKYGARMWVTFLFPNCQFDPGDGYPVVLTLNCFNSTDKSVAVRIEFAWHRNISDTEMVSRSFKKIHFKLSIKKDIDEDIRVFFALQLKRLQNEQNLYRKWYETKIDWTSVVSWLNKVVAPKWGTLAALRAHQIIKTGHDIEFENACQIAKTEEGIEIENVKSISKPLQLENFDFITEYRLQNQGEIDVKRIQHFLSRMAPDNLSDQDQLFFQGKGDQQNWIEFVSDSVLRNNKVRFINIKTGDEVPGLFTPVDNVYHISQVLSWLATERKTIIGKDRTIEDQLERLRQIPPLMDDLLKQAKLPVTLRIGREYKKSK